MALVKSCLIKADWKMTYHKSGATMTHCFSEIRSTLNHAYKMELFQVAFFSFVHACANFHNCIYRASMQKEVKYILTTPDMHNIMVRKISDISH